MISLDADRIAAFPVDQLGLVILNGLIATNQWNEHNYLLEASRTYRGAAAEAIAEAMAWLRARALIARTPGSSSDAAIFVTRTGRRVAAEGPQSFYANERLQGGVHERIENQVRPQFLIGQYEVGVFAAMRAVEVGSMSSAGSAPK